MDDSEILDNSTNFDKSIVLDNSTNSFVQISDNSNNIIKHLVLSGGGTYGLIAYGALKQSSIMGRWSIDNIQSIYGTSIGSMFAVVLALKYDWQTLDDYFIKRPWHHIFKYDVYSIFGAFERRGIFNVKIMEEMFLPLFSGLDDPIDINITMSQFFERTKIDIHVFATDMNAFETIDISHATHPKWRVIDAVYASSCLPIFFSPLANEAKYYVDGGIFLNYPLEPCYNRSNVNHDEILGIRKNYINSTNDNVTEQSNLMDYILILLNKTFTKLIKCDDNIKLKNEIVIDAVVISAFELFQMASSMDKRIELIDMGIKIALYV